MDVNLQKVGHERFQHGYNFTQLILQRLHADAMGVDPILWTFYHWENLLWALQRQIIQGSCDVSRSHLNYAETLKATDSYCRRSCFAFMPDSKLKKWEQLADMHKSEAIEKYLSILDRIAPGWDAPPDPAVSLSNPWMVNEDTTGCILCHEAFTFLNRRHHCRRCFALVCAPCSFDRMGIRLSPGTPIRIQRACKRCVMQRKKQSARSTMFVLPPTSLTDKQHPISPASSSQASRSSIAKLPLLSAPAGVSQPSNPRSSLSPGQSSSEEVSARRRMSRRASSKAPTSPTSSVIRKGTLEQLVGPTFRKSWLSVHITVLIRRGIMAIYHDSQDTTPSSTYELSGCTLRPKSERKRAHQFKVYNAEGNTILRFACISAQELETWIETLSSAIRTANGLQATMSQ